MKYIQTARLRNLKLPAVTFSEDSVFRFSFSVFHCLIFLTCFVVNTIYLIRTVLSITILTLIEKVHIGFA